MAEWNKSFDEQLAVEPPLTDEQLARIPAKRGVFALLAEQDRPVVILTAADMRARLRNRLAEPLDRRRRKTVDLREITRTVVWKLTTSHFETDLAFLEASRRMWPDSYAELLAWKPPWLVHVDVEAEYPHFFRTRDPAAAGRAFGPFPDGRSATHFVAAIQEVFDLCRDYSCLRQSPDAAPCAYAQMGRCLSPCDGTISMEAYRQVVAEAASFAAGRRERLRRELSRRMSQASADLRFEKAAAIKARIQRLAEFDKHAYRFVRPLGEFHYILVQSGGSARKLKVFLASRCLLRSAGTLDYPPRPARLRACLERMSALAARPVACGRLESLRMGLVANYLFSSPGRRGLIVHWHGALTADDLAESIEAARDDLKVSPPRPRKKRAADKDRAG